MLLFFRIKSTREFHPIYTNKPLLLQPIIPLEATYHLICAILFACRIAVCTICEQCVLTVALVFCWCFFLPITNYFYLISIVCHSIFFLTQVTLLHKFCVLRCWTDSLQKLVLWFQNTIEFNSLTKVQSRWTLINVSAQEYHFKRNSWRKKIKKNIPLPIHVGQTA